VIAVAVAAAGGDSNKKSSEDAQPAAKRTPKPDPMIPLSVKSPADGDSVHGDDVTVKGVSAPRARLEVTVDGALKRVKADKDGRWKVTSGIDVGENAIDVQATKKGFQDEHYALSITRRRTAAERAALRQARIDAALRKKTAFEASAETVPYNQLEKDPERYAGKKVKFTGQIFQIQQDYGSTVILLAVTNEGYDIWDDNVWVDYSGEIKGAEDDIITVYARVTGEKSYKTQIGGETYVPQVRAKYIEE
jgi:hypothetical protein